VRAPSATPHWVLHPLLRRRLMVTSEVAASYPFVDHGVARRLERAEAAVNVAFVEARARLQPEVCAAWTEVVGVHATFDGPHSPLTQTFGLGLFGSLRDAVFERIDDFFQERGAAVHHEVSPFIDPETLPQLGGASHRFLPFLRCAAQPVDGSSSPPHHQSRRHFPIIVSAESSPSVCPSPTHRPSYPSSGFPA
jgi:hypothetical protein